MDVLILAPSIISFEAVLTALPAQLLEGLLVVDVLSVKLLPKEAMIRTLPDSCDVVCTHPMFGPESGKHGWRDLPFVYDAVRVRDRHRFCRFLALWEEQVSAPRAARRRAHGACATAGPCRALSAAGPLRCAAHAQGVHAGGVEELRRSSFGVNVRTATAAPTALPAAARTNRRAAR